MPLNAKDTKGDDSVIKIITIVLAISIFFTAPVFARVICSIDNTQNAVMYRSYKKIMHFNNNDIIDFMKIIREDNTSSCHVQITYQGWGVNKRLISNTAEVIIDGTAYPIEKVVANNLHPVKPIKGTTSAEFLVPEDVLERIADFKNQLWFQFYANDKILSPMKLPGKELEEIRFISKLKYEDFQAVSSGQLRPIDPNAPKQELSFSERLKLKKQQ